MSDAPELLRLRALRRDSYRCQRREWNGRPCLRRTARVEAVEDQLVTDCGRH